MPDSLPDHAFHTVTVWDGTRREDIVWPHVEAQARREAARRRPEDERRRQMLEMARSINPEAREGPPAPFPPTSPVARTDDRWSAQVGARQIEPNRGTAAKAVLDYLRDRAGQWVNGLELRSPEVGGASGDRRWRELRALGWHVELRPPASGRGVWDYRLILESGEESSA